MLARVAVNASVTSYYIHFIRARLSAADRNCVTSLLRLSDWAFLGSMLHFHFSFRFIHDVSHAIQRIFNCKQLKTNE